MDTIPIGGLIAALIVLIFLSAFFSASEIAMMALNRYRLRHLADSGDRAALRVSKLLKRPDRLLGIILLGNNFVNILASSVVTILAIRLYGEAAIAIAAGLLTLVILILAEVAPKTFAATRPERVAFTTSAILQALLMLLYPFVWFINLIANRLLKILGVSASTESNTLSSEELRAAVMESGGLIQESHQSMLLAILDLEKLTVEDVMIPRGRIVGIDLEDEWDEIEEQITNARYTRLPVYRGTLDNIVGMVHLRKVLNLMQDDRLGPESFEGLLAEPYFIPEGTPVTTQLINFRSAKRRHGLVVDEYGDILGLVTLEEILEEIVGDFTTQSIEPHDVAQLQDDGSYLIPGRANLRDINRQLGWQLPTGDSRTLNGLITEYLEDLPAQDVSLKLGSYLVEIVRTRGTTVQLARVKPYNEPVSKQESENKQTT